MSRTESCSTDCYTISTKIISDIFHKILPLYLNEQMDITILCNMFRSFNAYFNVFAVLTRYAYKLIFLILEVIF